MSQWNIASFSKEEQDKVAVDKVAADVAWQERMNKPVMPELVEREQPEHLREYFHAGIIITLMLKGKEPGDEFRVLITVFAFLASIWYSVAQFRKENKLRS